MINSKSLQSLSEDNLYYYFIIKDNNYLTD